jgi:putative transcriptional regulator
MTKPTAPRKGKPRSSLPEDSARNPEDTAGMSAAGDYLTCHFLIAMPAMLESVFSQTVTLICEHNDKGALGIVINRPLQMRLADVFAQLKLPIDKSSLAHNPVLRGGPVQPDRGFVVHRAGDSWEATLQISDRVHVTTSRDVLDAMAHGKGPPDAFIALGYAGWDAGQLESEVAQNAWLTVPADERLLFDVPFEQRWMAAGRLLGVDLATMSCDAGHA